MLMSEQLRESMRQFLAAQEAICLEAAEIEQQILELDEDISRALLEEDDDNPLSRRLNWRATLWVQNGWYPSIFNTPLSLITQTVELLGTEDHERVELAIASHFESNAEEFIQSVVERHPARADILKDAIHAHLNDRFSLSIPVFLIQADGIASEFFDFDSIYTVNNKRFEQIKKKFDQQTDVIRVRYQQLLLGILTPLNASKRGGKRDLYSKPFNRHLVIHGESTDYPTKMNSLRAISWLHFISELVSPKA